jgi:hypothetical protein
MALHRQAGVWFAKAGEPPICHALSLREHKACISDAELTHICYVQRVGARPFGATALRDGRPGSRGPSLILKTFQTLIFVDSFRMRLGRSGRSCYQ